MFFHYYYEVVVVIILLYTVILSIINNTFDNTHEKLLECLLESTFVHRIQPVY